MLIKIPALIAVILLMSSGSLSQSPYFKNPPSDTKGAKDHDVTMYCQVSDKGKSNLYWHCNSENGQNDVTVGPNENTNPALSKYIIDNKGAGVGQYNLVITNVTELDSGKCSCIIDTGTGNAMEADADLEVMTATTAPDPPTCTINKDRTPGQVFRVFTAEDEIQLICESQDGVPLADIHWEIVRQGTNGRGVEILSSISTTSTTITAIADFTITSSDNGAYFQCVQTHVDLAEPQSCSPEYDNRIEIGSPDQLMQVRYRPVLRFIPSTLKVKPLETTKETLQCVSDSNPQLDSGPSIRYVPAQEGDKLTWNYTTQGKEDSVDLSLVQDDNGKVLECVATNELGSSVTTIKIESTGLLPTWILVIIIGGGGFVLFLIIAVVCCICFCGDDDDKDHHSLNRSRPGTFQGSELGVDDYGYGASDGGGYTEGYDDHDRGMVDIDEFEGGMEMKGHRQYDDMGGADNRGYLVDEIDDDDIDDNIPQAPPMNMKGTSSRTYDSVPMD